MPKLNFSNCIIIVLASAFQAFGIYNVHSLSNVTEGGVLGATLLVQHWFQISPALSALVLNIACYTLGWKTLGKSFLAYSAISILSYSASYALFEQFPPVFPGIADYPLLAALVGALFIGIGSGLCVKCGGATAGDDALAMSFSHILRWPIERVYLFSDLVVLILSLSYIPFRRIIYSLLTVILSGQIIGWIQKIKRRESHEHP